MSGIFRNHRIAIIIPFICSVLMLSCSTVVADEAVTKIIPEPTAKDIVISELSDPCQCVDAMLMTVTELIANDLEADSTGVEMQNLLDIESKIEYHCIDSLNFSKPICAECENFEKLEDAFQFFNRK